MGISCSDFMPSAYLFLYKITNFTTNSGFIEFDSLYVVD